MSYLVFTNAAAINGINGSRCIPYQGRIPYLGLAKVPGTFLPLIAATNAVLLNVNIDVANPTEGAEIT